jgi:hypothetical protein
MTTKVERTIIKADPGWYVAIYQGDEYSDFLREPIIAWLIAAEESDHSDLHINFTRYRADPLILRGNAKDHLDGIAVWAIQRPDGLFEFADGLGYRDEQDMFRWCGEEHRRQFGPSMTPTEPFR